MFLPPTSMSIDLITLAYSKFKSRKKKDEDISNNVNLDKSVSVFIPSFNEGEKLRSTVDHILQQTFPPKDIYILDDLSTDATVNVCKDLELRNENVYHIRRDEKLGKAGNINTLVKEKSEELGDYILIVDGDVKLDNRCLEELVECSDDAAVVTGFGATKQPTAYIPKMLYEGESWINSVFSFRKKAQNFRRAVFVICGALSLYDKNVLKEIPIPERTLTEDTDYTWLLQEKGYKINYTDKARALGNNPNTFQGYWRRYRRWSSGTFQGLFFHGKELKKSKPLLYSTIIPGCLEVVPYSIMISSLPFLAFEYPNLAKGLLAADLTLSFPFLFFHPKGFWHALNHLPDIYAYKYFGSVNCVSSGLKTLKERIFNQQYRWQNNWVNSSRARIEPKTLTQRYMKKRLDDFLFLEREWVALGEREWDRDNFLKKLPKKWNLSNYVNVDGKTVGYALLSKLNKSGREAYLHKIIVDRDYQGLGIGNLLFKDARERCKRKGIKKIMFKVRIDNDSAINLYKQNNTEFVDREVSNDYVQRYLCELKI